MKKLTREELLSLEDYAAQRTEFRCRVLAHKQNRMVALGAHARLCFEDRVTMQYQVQEMLRAERIFEKDGIQDELEVYNALVPDGTNWKATFLLEYEDPEHRRKVLATLGGIEHRLWFRVGDGEPFQAIANEDLERSTEERTAAVHFLRIEVPEASRQALRNGAALSCGTDHPNYRETCDPVPEAVRQSLLGDLD